MAALQIPQSLVAADTPQFHNLTIDGDPCSEFFLTPRLEQRDPLLSEDPLFRRDDTGHSNAHDHHAKVANGSRLKVPETGHARRGLRRSSSDLSVYTRRREKGTSESSVETAVHVGPARHVNHETESQSGVPLQRALRRSSSNSLLETSYKRDRPAAGLATLQQRLRMQIERSSNPSSRPYRVDCAGTASGPTQTTNPRAPGAPGFKWSPVRSNSDPSSIPQTTTRAGRRGNGLPLKPCMKQKSKSAATTPPSEHNRDSEDPKENQKLHRVKTVDFEESISKGMLSLPFIKVWADDTRTEALTSDQRVRNGERHGAARPAGVLTRFHSCPGPNLKSKPADTAVTRTDVHVVAITPSTGVDDVHDETGLPSATPTMQVVESGEGRYEVIWDDIPPEDEARTQRRSSSASISLHAANSTSKNTLERVSTKLTEWSWSRDSPSEPFKAQIVVFPDEDGRARRLGSTVEDKEDLLVPAPPNSERTTANPSRQPSHPSSAHISRTPSYDDLPLDLKRACDIPDGERGSTQDVLVIPYSDITQIKPGARIGASRGETKPPTGRRLSDLDDTEVRFRGHRDSVTIARSRIFHTGGISPELFIHRDPVSAAKKRMHAKNHAISAARKVPRPKIIASDSPPSVDGADLSPPLTTRGIQKATQSLRSSVSESMLAPQPANNHRSIRIME